MCRYFFGENLFFPTAIVRFRVRESISPGNFIAKIEADDPDEDHQLKYYLDTEHSEARSEEGAVVRVSGIVWCRMFA